MVIRETATGGDATDAQNNQDQLLNNLSQVLDIAVTRRSDGAVDIRTGEGALLLGRGGPATLSFASTGPTAGDVMVASSGARLYQGACAVCHEVGGLPLFGSRPSLALNSNLHSAVPDNLIQVILHGIMQPASSDLGYMPAFKDSLNDEQIAELVAYLRRQFAPDKPDWGDVRTAVSRIRASSLE